MQINKIKYEKFEHDKYQNCFLTKYFSLIFINIETSTRYLSVP